MKPASVFALMQALNPSAALTAGQLVEASRAKAKHPGEDRLPPEAFAIAGVVGAAAGATVATVAVINPFGLIAYGATFPLSAVVLGSAAPAGAAMAAGGLYVLDEVTRGRNPDPGKAMQVAGEGVRAGFDAALGLVGALV